MGAKDILALLEKIPLWKRLTELPDKVDALERRIAALEKKPKLPICEACGEGSIRLNRTEKPTGHFAIFGEMGTEIKVYRCDKCGMETKQEPD